MVLHHQKKRRLNGKQSVKKHTLKAKGKRHPTEPKGNAAAKAKKNAKAAAKAKKSAKDTKSSSSSSSQNQKRVPKQQQQQSKRGKKEHPKADGGAHALQVGTACRKGITHADALILSAHGSCNAATGRFDIQGRCTLPDGSCKTIGILGFTEKAAFGLQVWKTLLAKGKQGNHTKLELSILRDKLIADCKAGNPCIDPDAH